MNIFERLCYKLPRALQSLVTFRAIAWYLLAVAATYAIVMFGLDANYFMWAQTSSLYGFFSLAGFLGFFIPFFIFLIFLVVGSVTKNKRTMMAAWMSAQAGILGFGLSSFVKIFTGRIQPPHGIVSNVLQVSHGFRFGILEGGVFWGWPSSHTATAFAISVAIAVYYKDKKWLGVIAILYALYIGIGASMSFHWLSDVVAGLILGCVIGVAAGRNFRESKKL
ncbi:MAG: phosphoesterase PA-phosphatase related protein [Patescibacteria group bacterium]|nr:phosphoesterase PA-phosphatase related protein [Patescibacteria group bacterium]